MQYKYILVASGYFSAFLSVNSLAFILLLLESHTVGAKLMAFVGA